MTKQQKKGWKTLLGCTIAGLCAAISLAQTSAPPIKDDLFAGTEKFAQGATSVTQIDMDPDTLSEVKGKDTQRARTTVLSVVHTYGYDKPGMYRIEDVEAFRKKLETGDWHCSVHIREMKTGESTDVCNKRRDDGLTEKAIITVQPKSLTFIHTIGKASWSKSGMELSLPAEMRLNAPEMRAEMAIARAQMQAEMATLGPQLQAQFVDLKNFYGADLAGMQGLREQRNDLKVPSAAELKRLQDEVNRLSGKQSEDGKTPPQ